MKIIKKNKDAEVMVC